ncbi:unnamed protein product [Prunus armeniaca]|uniref:Uncharacterized protein n=1 Tax=Prunus armeniaca TaxID=36596 RepID=A0A6J5TRT1_PRUAR|nr:unnamed protein product [Prunus armeniaca]
MVVSDSVKERRVDLGSGEAGQCRWRTWAWWRSWAVGLGERERERESTWWIWAWGGAGQWLWSLSIPLALYKQFGGFNFLAFAPYHRAVTH